MDTSWCCQKRTTLSGIKGFPGWGETSFTVTTRRALDRNMLVTVLRAGSRGRHTGSTSLKSLIQGWSWSIDHLSPCQDEETAELQRWRMNLRLTTLTGTVWFVNVPSLPQPHCSDKCLFRNFTGSGFCTWFHLECLETVTWQLSHWGETTIPELDCTWII